MKNLNLSNEQVEILKANPFTAYVSQNDIKFTLIFKRMALEQSSLKGFTSVKIFEDAGYPLSIFDRNQLYQFMKAIKREASTPGGLKEPKDPRQKLKKKQRIQEANEKKIQNLEERIEYLEQELEFVKKTAALRKSLQKKQ